MGSFVGDKDDEFNVFDSKPVVDVEPINDNTNTDILYSPKSSAKGSLKDQIADDLEDNIQQKNDTVNIHITDAP